MRGLVCDTPFTRSADACLIGDFILKSSYIYFAGEARDAIIELIMKNCPYNELDWACKMLSTDGYQRLLEVASELEAYKHESAMEITASTRY